MQRISIFALAAVCAAFLCVSGCRGAGQAKTEEAAPPAAERTMSDVEKELRENEAQEAYRQGALARQANDLKKAREFFEKALALNPAFAEAADALAQVKIAMGEAAPEAAGTALRAKKIEAEMQLIRHEVKTDIEEAKTLYRQEKFDETIAALEDALARMRYATELFMLDFAQERIEAEELLKVARVQQDVFRQAREAEEIKQAEQKIAEELRVQAEYRRRQAEEMLARARESLEKKNFADALKFARQAEYKDPGNAEAIALQDIIVRQRINFERERIILRTEMALRRSFFKMEEAALPMAAIMSWPDKEEWSQMTGLRRQRAELEQKVFERTAEQEHIEKILDQKTVRLLRIERQAFPVAVQTIMKQFDNVVPIVLHPDVVSKLGNEEIEIDRSVETTLKTAIEIALENVPKELGNFTYIIKDEAVLITPRGAEETKHLIIYPVQDLLRELVPFTPPNVEIKREDIFKETTEYESGDYFGEASAETQGEWDFQDPENLDTDSLKDLIINTLGGGPEKWNYAESNPDAPSTLVFLKGNMLITATESIHGDVQKTLADIRATNEVLVTLEARFLRVEEGVVEEIGIDLKGNPTAFQQLRNSDLGLDFSDDFLEGMMNDVGYDTTKGDLDGVTDSQPTSGIFFAKRDAGVGYKDGEKIFLNNGVPTGDALGLRSENILDQTLTQALANQGGLLAGFSLRPGTSRINMVLEAVINSSRTTTLAAPKITTYNHQPAYIAIIKEQRFIGSVKDAQKSDPDDPASVDPIPSLLPSGIVLHVRPTVTWDRKYVILQVLAYATIGTLEKVVPLDLTPPAGRVANDQQQAIEQPKLVIDFDFPRIDTQNIKTTVMIPDGGTVILGGLSELKQASGSASTPLLGDIPIVKLFFSKQANTTSRKSLIVLLKANITVVPEGEKLFMQQ